METVWVLIRHVLLTLRDSFLSPGSILSLTSLGCAFAVALAFIAIRHYRRRGRFPLKVIRRALFPRRITRHPSTLLDLGYLFFSLFIFGAIFSWALLSYQVVSNGIIGALASAFGARTPTALPDPAARALLTLAMFVAYELGYWFQHYLCHRVPFLWEFHKVHHTANVLTPLTVFRVHPVDTWLFANILALSLGATNGVVNYALGITAYQYALSNTNILLVAFIHIFVHLQHTHLWIAFRGLAGRVFVSPAHHQVHHSSNPIHFNKNLGSCLALWDWLFGTLHVPAKEPEKLRFGVDPSGRDEHTFAAGYLMPLSRAARRLLPRGSDREARTTLASGTPASAAKEA